MNVSRTGRLVVTVLALICLGATLLSCGILANQDGNQPDKSEQEQTGGGEEPQEEGEDPIQDDGEDNVNAQGDEPVEPAFDSDTLPCPLEGTSLFLGFDHALTVNHQEASINHFLHQGWLELKVVDDKGTIQSVGSPSLTYSMEGKFSEECSLTAEGTMTPSAHGSCEAGVVRLFIEENWQALNGEMECIDNDGDIVIMPFNVPPMGLQEHKGPDGNGEIFYLVEGADGYSSMRPFVEGEGYHTWTLYTAEIPVVPLVPEE